MPQFIWSDGSIKYLHIDVHRLEHYMVEILIYGISLNEMYL